MAAVHHPVHHHPWWLRRVSPQRYINVMLCVVLCRHVTHFMHRVPFPSSQRPRILVQVSRAAPPPGGESSSRLTVPFSHLSFSLLILLFPCLSLFYLPLSFPLFHSLFPSLSLILPSSISSPLSVSLFHSSSLILSSPPSVSLSFTHPFFFSVFLPLSVSLFHSSSSLSLPLLALSTWQSDAESACVLSPATQVSLTGIVYVILHKQKITCTSQIQTNTENVNIMQ